MLNSSLSLVRDSWPRILATNDLQVNTTPWKAFGPGWIVPPTLDAQSRRHIVYAWLQACTQQHSNCSLPAYTELPKRYLDLRDVLQGVIQLNEAKGEIGRYATVSHCWGESVPLTTTKATLDVRKSGIPLSELPKSFQEAILIAMEQNISFIWIDSLCIIQDDESDWTEHVRTMADIYSNSYLNIGLTRAPDSHTESMDHIIHVRQKLAFAHDKFTGTLNDTIAGTIFAYSNAFACAPLLTRAWVFQERVLAPRMLHIHASEMIWECNSTMRCECTGLDNLLPQSHYARTLKKICSVAELGNDIKEPLESFWQWAVMEYTKLKLSKESDRLPAFAGLAARFQTRSGSRYVAGMWLGEQFDFARQLSWRVYEESPRGSLQSRRSIPLKAPTWSWASL
ncbi:HET-domain-containing protein, partial [Polyplosphaeria fusca]